MSQIIKEIKRNEREIVRFDVSEFKDKQYINIRIWYQAIDNGGNIIYKPTQKGIALGIDQIAELKDAVLKLEEYIIDFNNNVVPDLNSTEEYFSDSIDFDEE